MSNCRFFEKCKICSVGVGVGARKQKELQKQYILYGRRLVVIIVRLLYYIVPSVVLQPCVYIIRRPPHV